MTARDEADIRVGISRGNVVLELGLSTSLSFLFTSFVSLVIPSRPGQSLRLRAFGVPGDSAVFA